jgi:predicted RND superfamily exporter protein
LARADEQQARGAGRARAFIQIQPKLDFGALQPGRAAIDVIRQTADELKLGPMFGTSLRLTGQVAIDDEQFAKLSKSTVPNFVGTVLAVLVILWLALRSAHTNLAVFVSLFVGFVVTAAAGLLIVGAFNLISIAFGILFRPRRRFLHPVRRALPVRAPRA